MSTMLGRNRSIAQCQVCPIRHLVGGRNLVADVRHRLTSLGINPDCLSRNGVIAYEAILTASAECFDAGADEERRQRLEAWTEEQVR